MKKIKGFASFICWLIWVLSKGATWVVPAIICASSKAKKYEGDLGIPIIFGIVFLFLFLFGIIDKLPEFVLMGSLFYLTTGLVASVKIRKKYHKSFLED